MTDPRGPMPDTRLSLIEAMVDPSPEVRQAGLERFAREYQSGIRAYVAACLSRSAGRADPDKVDEVVQQFILNRLLKNNLFEGFDPDKGSLRARILQMLKWEMGKSFRTRKVDRQRQPLGEDQSLDDFADAHIAEAEQAFNRAFLRQVIEQIAARMKEEFEQKNKPEVWLIFERRLLRPILDETEPPAYDEQFVAQCGIKSPAEAAARLVTAKRAFARHKNIVLQEAGASPGGEMQEVIELLDSLG